MMRWQSLFLAIALFCLAFLPPACAEEYRWPSYKGVYQYSDNGKVGLKDDAGNILLECEFDSISYFFQDGFAIVKKDGRTGYINQQWQLVIPPHQDEPVIDYASEGITTFRYNEFSQADYLCGFLDLATGEIVFLPYDKIRYCQEGLMMVSKNGLVGFVDKSGDLVIDFRWLSSTGFSQGISLVEDEEGLLFIDKNENPLFDKRWDKAMPFSGGCAPVCSDDLWGLIDTSGNLIADYLWDEIYSFDSVYFVRKGERWGLLDSSGSVLFEPQWDKIVPSWEDKPEYLFVVENGLYGIVNREGRMIKEPYWKSACSISGEYAALCDENGLYSLVDSSGNILFSTDKHIHGVSENLVTVGKGWGGKCGFLDMQGNTVIPCIYTYADGFHEGLCAVQQGDKWGYINTTGEVVIPFCFDTASEFADGVAWVSIGETQCSIGKDGQLLSGLTTLPEASGVPDASAPPIQDLQNGYDSLKEQLQSDPS